MKISCLFLTYNEQDRIVLALSHALKWADEVVVVDKGSTDNTRQLADAMGARVHVIPFSKQGHEDLAQFSSFAANDWVWAFTPGEMPTRGVITAGRALADRDFDLVRVPMLYYSFGIHSERSPWSGGYQPRLYHRGRVTFTGIAHDPMRAERVTSICHSEECHVLHQTHPGAESFMRSHADYMINEARNGTPEEAIARANHAMSEWAGQLASSIELYPHALAWRIYWLGVALHAWEIRHPGIKEQYGVRAADMLTREWGGH